MEWNEIKVSTRARVLPTLNLLECYSKHRKVSTRARVLPTLNKEPELNGSKTGFNQSPGSAYIKH